MKIVVRYLAKFDDEDKTSVTRGFRVSIDDVVVEKWEEDFDISDEVLETVLEMLGHTLTFESDFEDWEEYDEYDVECLHCDADDLPGHR